MAILTFFILCYLSSVSSINSTDCNYLYVSPDSFTYNGWYQYSKNETKFGTNYWYSVPTPHVIQLLIFENKWYFYNWDNKDESFTLSQEHNTNIYSLPITFTNDTISSTWNSINDGTQITLNIVCYQNIDTSIGDITSLHTTTIPDEEEIIWLINNENCHIKSRGYVAFITNDISSTEISAFWDIPTLHNHTSNITVSISGNHNQYEIGQHKITYAAENKQYFIMCQITVYVIGDISEQDMYKCTQLDSQRIGIIDLIVDTDTFLVIDPNKYEYQISDTKNNPIQVSYITPDLADRHIICYINIKWANIGDIVSHSSNDNNSSNTLIIWRVLIILCIVAIFALICERIYFYRRIYKTKYQSVEDVADLSLNMDEMDPVHLPAFGRNAGYQQPRSFSESAVNNMMRRVQTDGNNRGVSRAMSMQISSDPFTRPPAKEEFLQQRRTLSSSKSMDINDEIVPLSMNNNPLQTTKKRKQRYMSVPTNLMSDNVLKKHDMKEEQRKPNVDFWKKELRVLKDAGFESKKKNLCMLVKYTVKNDDEVIDKRMTQSVVIRILQKEKTQKIKNEEMENFLEHEWENKEQIIVV